MKISEELLDRESIDNVTSITEEVLSQIRLPKADSLLHAIDLAVYDWQDSGSPPESGEFDKDDVLYAFGTTWGNAIVSQHGWHWSDLTFHEHDDWVGRSVVSPDASLYILPYAHIHECLGGSDEVKISASLSVINSNVIPPLDANSYTNLIHNIQRIIPRL